MYILSIQYNFNNLDLEVIIHELVFMLNVELV